MSMLPFTFSLMMFLMDVFLRTGKCALLSKFIFCSFFVQCSFNYSERFGKLILSGGRVSFVIKSINSINIYIQYSYKVLPEFVYFFSVSTHTIIAVSGFSFSLLSYYLSILYPYLMLTLDLSSNIRGVSLTH